MRHMPRSVRAVFKHGWTPLLSNPLVYSSAQPPETTAFRLASSHSVHTSILPPQSPRLVPDDNCAYGVIVHCDSWVGDMERSLIWMESGVNGASEP
jgi:hypothetical protein